MHEGEWNIVEMSGHKLDLPGQPTLVSIVQCLHTQTYPILGNPFRIYIWPGLLIKLIKVVIHFQKQNLQLGAG